MTPFNFRAMEHLWKYYIVSIILQPKDYPPHNATSDKVNGLLAACIVGASATRISNFYSNAPHGVSTVL